MRVHFKRLHVVAYYNSYLTCSEQVLLDIDCCLSPKEWAVPPLVSINALTNNVEMLLMSKVARTQRQWQQILTKVIGLSVQSCDTLSRNAIGSIERMIYTRAHRTGSPWVRFMDAYRLLSGGFMHQMDGRDWAMSRRALKKLRERLTAEDAALDSYNGVYNNADTETCVERAMLVETISQHARSAGAFYTVLQKQQSLTHRT